MQDQEINCIKYHLKFELIIKQTQELLSYTQLLTGK